MYILNIFQPQNEMIFIRRYVVLVVDMRNHAR